MRRWQTTVCLVLLAMFASSASIPASSAVPDTLSLVYTVAKSYDPLAWMNGKNRFAAGSAIFVEDGKGRRPLAPDLASSADPNVSFDGKRVLFSGTKQPGGIWQIWEIVLEDNILRQVTACSNDCVRPFYLPDDRFTYSHKVDGRLVIDVAPLAGGASLQLTYGPENSLPTDVLLDGRLLFETTHPFGTKRFAELYTVYSDGSGVEAYRCDHGRGRYAGRQMSSGDIVFASAQGLGRFTSPLAHAIPVKAPAGEYAGDVVDTPSGKWILARRSGPTSPFLLASWTPGTAALSPLVSLPGMNVVQAALLGERSVPKRHPSGLHDWSNANLLCLNAYTSKHKFAAGSIHSVRLFTQNAGGSPILLGTAPVERDGSFYVQVPTEQPLQIEILDAAGTTLNRESGWFWMRRGEQRACVGCHAGPETAPENAVPMVLLRSTTPTDMTGQKRDAASGGH
jgi:hydrazine synthase alpha subunit-like protein